MLSLRHLAICSLFFALTPFGAGAQNLMAAPPNAEAPPPGTPAPDMGPPPGAQEAPPDAPAPQNTYPPQQLDQMMAPIALYPDQLVSQILMASTYPLEVVQADRWRQDPANASLSGDQLAAAIDQQNWDPSVKSLVPFPQVLKMMDSNLQWTEQLGDAFMANQGAVMDSVQRLRAQAQASGNLQSTPQQIVTAQQGAIEIQPAQPQVVYVPYYNPTVVYGAWPYAGYPPYVFPPFPGYAVGAGLFGFGVGIAVIDRFWGWNHWDWGHREIYVDPHRYASINHDRPPPFRGDAWSHDPAHRHGVPYQSAGVRQQYQGAAADARRGYRGYTSNANEVHGDAVRANAPIPNAAPQHFNGAAQPHANAGATSLSNSPAAQHQANFQRPASPAVAPVARPSTPQTTAPQTRTAFTHPASAQQRSAPMFESFARGSDVRAQAARGAYSRASMPASAAIGHQSSGHAGNGGGVHGGGGGGSGGGHPSGGGHADNHH